jgi:hypothetical protein
MSETTPQAGLSSESQKWRPNEKNEGKSLVVKNERSEFPFAFFLLTFHLSKKKPDIHPAFQEPPVGIEPRTFPILHRDALPS